jgi:hypothetical protein
MICNVLGFGALTAVVMKIPVFLNIISYILLKFCRRFGGTCRLNIHARNQSEADFLFLAWRDLGPLVVHSVKTSESVFDPEDGGSMYDET